jgi:ABC-type uncharacterized transport system permease subunit
MAIHITSNLLGGGIVLVAGCAAAFYLVNERRLKSRRVLGQGPKLPPLESLDTVVHRLLWIGLPLAHHRPAHRPHGHQARRSHHLWRRNSGRPCRAQAGCCFSAVLVVRQFASWRGRRPAYATLGGALGIFIVIALYIARALLGDGL